SITGSARDGTSAPITFVNGAVSTVGDVSLTANGGSITEGAPNTGPDVTAGDGATFTTTRTHSAIGTAATPIPTAIGALTATTNDGGVYIPDSNGPGLIINSVLAREGGQTPFLNGSNHIVVFDSDGKSNPHAGTDSVSITATGPILFASGASVST